MRKSVVLFVVLFIATFFIFGVGCGKSDKVLSESLDAAKAVPENPGQEAAVAPENAGVDLSKYPAGEEGAKQLLLEFLKGDIDKLALTGALKPKPEDYMAIFATEEMGKKALAHYEELWQMLSTSPIAPNEGQTALLLWGATTDELKAGTGNSAEFPGGYKKVAAQLKPGLTVYRWKFVAPGETSGMAFDGLYSIDGRWIIVPKPWRI